MNEKLTDGVQSPSPHTTKSADAEKLAVLWCGLCAVLCILCETWLRSNNLPPDTALVSLAGVAVGALAAGVPGWTGYRNGKH